MSAFPLFDTEKEFAGLMIEAVKHYFVWILVAALAGGIAAAIAVRYQPLTATAQATYTLADGRIQELAEVYRDFPAQSQLLLGAVEIDELARIAALLQHPEIWQQADAKLSSRAFSFEHRRRGNLLMVRLKDADPQRAVALLEKLMQATINHYREQKLQQLQMEISAQQQALSDAASIGERTILTQQLDALFAKQYLWRQTTLPVLHSVLPLQAKSPTARPLFFAAVVGSLLMALIATLGAVLCYRR